MADNVRRAAKTALLMRRPRPFPLLFGILAIAAVATAAPGSQPAPAAISSTQPALPRHFALGLEAGPNPNGTIATWMGPSHIPWDFAWTYLNRDWATTSSGAQVPGRFASDYANQARTNHFTPFFTYYVLGSLAPNTCPAEAPRNLCALGSGHALHTYFADFRLLMERLGPGTHAGFAGYGGPAVVQIEPDLAGMTEQGALNPPACHGFCSGQGNDPALVEAAVAASHDPAATGMPNNFIGFNWTLLHLRDKYAPNVRLAFHLSNWATNVDISSDTNQKTNGYRLGQKAARFIAKAGFRGLPTTIKPFDLVTNDPADHDAAWMTAHGCHACFWDAANIRVPNFHRWERYLLAVHQITRKPIYGWQMPIGNQYFDTENNTNGHWQDNKAQYILHHIGELTHAGVRGILFGAGGINTNYYDANRDGVTNPAPRCSHEGNSTTIVCNTHKSTHPDDDGGYLRQAAARYYRHPYRL